MSTSIRGEVDGYINELKTMEEQLTQFKARMPEHSILRADASVSLLAVTSLRTQISSPDYVSTVNLQKIVELTEAVRDLSISTTRLLNRAN